MEYLQCLCYLLEHPANRNSERCGKSIPLLIQLLHEFQEPSNKVLECCILLVASLNKCRYDDSLMLEQLKCNIVQILVNKLQWLVGRSNTLNIEHKHVKKRKYDLSNSPISHKRYGTEDVSTCLNVELTNNFVFRIKNFVCTYIFRVIYQHPSHHHLLKKVSGYIHPPPVTMRWTSLNLIAAQVLAPVLIRTCQYRGRLLVLVLNRLLLMCQTLILIIIHLFAAKLIIQSFLYPYLKKMLHFLTAKRLRLLN